MKYIFFGTPRFAAIVLKKLVEAGLAPTALVCNPDEPVGRKKILTPPATKSLILGKKINIPIFQPAKLTTSEVVNLLKKINADVFIVAAYNKIISEEIISIPKFKTIGVHPSLLPNYRGPSPIQTAILNSDKKTGVDLFLIDKGIDHGPVLVSVECDILEKDNYLTLEEKLATLGAKLLIENLQKYLNGKLKATEQDHSKATFTKKFSTEDGKVDLPPSVIARTSESVAIPDRLLRSARNDKSEEYSKAIFNKIRALNPDPGVFTFIKIPTRGRGSSIPTGIGTKSGDLSAQAGKRVKLLEAELKDGKLELLKVQPEGKKPMSFKDFQNGLQTSN